MKKVFMGMFAIATMLLATSCSEDELISQSSGNEVTVSFTANVRSDVKTKAVGDDTDGIDELIFAVYDENKNLLEELTQKVSEGDFTLSSVNEKGQRTATINVVLVKGQTYSFAFWAQNKDYAAYSFNPATKLVSVNYGQTANNKNADAFFANETLTVSGSFEKDITLKRPFAQVNFLTTQTDIDKAEDAGFVPSQSSIVVKNAATSLNVLDGTVTGSTEATFTLASLIEETETTTIKDAQGNEIKFEKDNEVTNFRYLATAYFLTTEGAAGTTIDASMNVVAEDNGKMDLSVPGVNAQRNFRTNIYGNLLTSGGKFNVTVDPGFDGDYSVEVEEETVTYDKLSDALTANIDNTDALTYNVEAAGEQHSVSIEIPAGTSAASLTFSLEDLAENATISVSNAAGGDYDNPVVIEVPEGVNLGALTVEVPNAHVTLKQGSYTTVVSTTSSTTLEVGAGTTIETLTVNQGNVRIAEGGKVGTITNSTEGTLYVLMAGGEWTKITEKDAKTIVIYEDTKRAVILNDKYSADNMADLLGYANDVLVLSDNITIDMKAGEYTFPKIEQKITLICEEGTVFNGKSSFNIAGSTIVGATFQSASDNLVSYYSSINGIFKDCNFFGDLKYSYAGETVVFENCEFNGPDYAIHFDSNASGVTNTKVILKNCVINSDWRVAIGAAISMFEATDCKFNVKGFINMWGKATFTNCEFNNPQHWIANMDYTEYTNCKFEGRVLTANDILIDDTVIKVNGEYFASSVNGLKVALEAGATEIGLTANTYDATKFSAIGKTLTLKGVGENVVIDINQNNAVALGTFDGSNVTFENLTIKTPGGIYKGFARMEGIYNNCTFENLYFTFQGKHQFNECIFNANNDEHCIWTYGANDVEFNDCEFNYTDRCINVYTEMGVAEGKLTCTDCNFSTENTSSKGAVEINSSSFKTSVAVNMNSCEKPANGEMVFISGWDNANGSKATVTIDGTVVTVPQLAK